MASGSGCCWEVVAGRPAPLGNGTNSLGDAIRGPALLAGVVSDGMPLGGGSWCDGVVEEWREGGVVS